MQVGEQLKSRRIGLGMSVARVAKLTYLSRKTIYNVENGLGPKATAHHLDLFYKEFEDKLNGFHNRWL